MPSPFFNPGTSSSADQLAILHLRRDALLPTVLRTHDDEDQGYEEGKVATTRFGSFPHSTLIGQPWGSQIAASDVNTGGRRVRGKQNKRKRKAAVLNDEASTVAADDASDLTASATAAAASAVSPKAASSGFLHLLPPTPESWTSALPHRTQVVYTPDYSYILHRLRVWPGKTIIEAGAGSGSFTHAAARAVFNGYVSHHRPAHDDHIHKKQKKFGKVCSFEFHETRASKIQEELKLHGLEDIVKVTHRDVYNDGFLLGDSKTGESPKANAVFLDLPAPWLALKHLVRSPTDGSVSPLDPLSAVHICSFSPCIEQVQTTISALRQHGWTSISMVEVMHRRLDVRREMLGLDMEGVRHALTYPKSVDEAVGKLRSVETRHREYRQLQKDGFESDGGGGVPITTDKDLEKDSSSKLDDGSEKKTTTKTTSLQSQIQTYDLGRLAVRSEPDLKTHTSYLVFAVLPRTWSAEEERKQRELWPSRPK